jgi:hypothetical protein
MEKSKKQTQNRYPNTYTSLFFLCTGTSIKKMREQANFRAQTSLISEIVRSCKRFVLNALQNTQCTHLSSLKIINYLKHSYHQPFFHQHAIIQPCKLSLILLNVRVCPTQSIKLSFIFLCDWWFNWVIIEMLNFFVISLLIILRGL